MSRTLNFFATFFILTAYLYAGPTKLVNTKTTDDSVVLEFSSNLDKSNTKNSTLDDPKDKNTYRNFIDISAILSEKPISLGKKHFFEDLRISQFDKGRVRIVFLLNKKIKLNYKISGKQLIIEKIGKVEPASTEAPKQQTTKEVSDAKDIMNDLNLALEPPKTDKKPEIDPILDKFVKPASQERSKVIVIDPGHGGKDSGAIGIGSKLEKDVVFSTALIVKDALEKHGYKVILTRDSDYFVELQDRTRFANNKLADLFISIHANAVDLKHSDPGKAKGIETFFLSPARSDRAKRVAQKENGANMEMMDDITKGAFLNVLNREKIVSSNKLAIDVHRATLSNLRAKYKDTADGGVREAPFWVLVGAQMPAILIEIGYITNPDESARFENPYFKALLAKGIADGLDKYFDNN